MSSNGQQFLHQQKGRGAFLLMKQLLPHKTTESDRIFAVEENLFAFCQISTGNNLTEINRNILQ